MTTSFRAWIERGGTKVSETHAGTLTPYAVELLRDMARRCGRDGMLRIEVKSDLGAGDAGMEATLLALGTRPLVSFVRMPTNL